jgi:hypothetical protein
LAFLPWTSMRILIHSPATIISVAFVLAGEVLA